MCDLGSSSEILIAFPIRTAKPEITIDDPDGEAVTRVQTPVRKKASKISYTGVHSEEPDLKVEIADGDDDVVVGDQFDLSAPTGARTFGPHGDRMPVAPERRVLHTPALILF